MSWYRRLPDGALSICVHAQPGARRTEVAGLHGEALRIRVAAPATEDRANAALVEFIAERHARGRVVSTLEGGYNNDALGRCVVEHVSVLAQ